jgi:hypothetical protein
LNSGMTHRLPPLVNADPESIPSQLANPLRQALSNVIQLPGGGNQ